MLGVIGRGEQRKIVAKIDGLKNNPDAQGKPLVGELKGFRRLAAASRYRVVYKVYLKSKTVVIVAIGIRKEGDKNDVYEIVKKLLAAGELEE